MAGPALACNFEGHDCGYEGFGIWLPACGASYCEHEFSVQDYFKENAIVLEGHAAHLLGSVELATRTDIQIAGRYPLRFGQRVNVCAGMDQQA